jgi:dipeptidyl aminopeptidase/acylaminoacyl peptidase
VATPGTLQGTVYNPEQSPLEGAWVLVSRWDGTTYSSRSDANGRYSIDNIPPGTYRPVAGAPGYEKIQFGNLFASVRIKAEATTTADVTLPVESPRLVIPGHDLQFGEPVTRTCTRLFNNQATRQQIHFRSGDQLNQPSFYYTPITTTSQLPILLAVYPGPADSWECASIPLTAAGYAVLAVGPAYSFDLEADVDELERLLDFARAGRFPGGDGSRIALLGGSYSSLHVQLLLQRGEPVAAALLLGPPPICLICAAVWRMGPTSHPSALTRP